MEQPLKINKNLTPTLKWKTGTQDVKTLLDWVIIDDKTFHRRWTFRKKFQGFFYTGTHWNQNLISSHSQKRRRSRRHTWKRNTKSSVSHTISHTKQAHLYQAHSMDFDIKWIDESWWRVLWTKLRQNRFVHRLIPWYRRGDCNRWRGNRSYRRRYLWVDRCLR